MKSKDMNTLGLKPDSPAIQPEVLSIILHSLLKILRWLTGLNLTAPGNEEKRKGGVGRG